MEQPRWLTDEQQRAWRKLAAVLLRLPATLEAQLQRDAGISHFEYAVLSLLSDSPGRNLRLGTLATYANASLSRLSHVVTRLEKRGWVERRPCPEDARSILAVLTDAGYDKVVAAAPGHVAIVRATVFDHLDAHDVARLAGLCDAILAGISAVPKA